MANHLRGVLRFHSPSITLSNYKSQTTLVTSPHILITAKNTFKLGKKTNAQLLASNNIPKHGDLENIFSDLISDYLSPVVEATANQSISGDEWQTGRCFFPNSDL